MIRNAKKILGYMAAGAAGAFLLTLGAHYILMHQTRKDVEEDLAISADLMLERASDATTSAIEMLNKLVHTNGLSCTSDHRYLYSEAVRANPWIDTIGLVDRNGNLVCTDLGQSSRQAGLLPAYKPGGQETTLSLSGGSALNGDLSLLVVRHIDNGRRLIARIPGQLIKLDPVRNDLRQYRAAMLSLGTGDAWYILEPEKVEGAAFVRVHRSLDRLPFEVQLSLPRQAVEIVASGNGKIIDIFGIVIGLLSLVGGYFMGRYRPNEGDCILLALENGEFEPYMQPIVDLDTGQITGCEVLARWTKADGSVVPPHEFIPLAQNYRLTREVTSHIMIETRDRIEPLVEAGQSFKVAFNLFSSQLADDTIIADIRDVFKDSKLGFDNLIFEISDRVPINDVALANDVLTQIQALGSEIALDDVGSGHSGLHNLTSISVDILKIDKLLVDSLKKGFAGFELVRGLIDLAATLNVGVIAEGIETEQQVVELRKMGVSAAQGYLFAPPLPASSFVRLMMASQSRRAKKEETGQAASKEAVEEAA